MNQHITFEGPADEDKLQELDRFEWRGRTEDVTYLHTKVLWKGQHILTIKKHVNVKPRSPLDDDDEAEDFEVERKAEPDASPDVEWLVHTEWDWLKHYYGKFTTLEKAKAAAAKEVEGIMVLIRKAFALRSPKARST